MSNNHRDSGDNGNLLKWNNSAAYFKADAFLPYSIDAGDVHLQQEDEVQFSDEGRIFYESSSTTPFEYPKTSAPEINAQYLKELETDKWLLISMMQSLTPNCFHHALNLIDEEISRVESVLGGDLVASVLSGHKTSVNGELNLGDGEIVSVEEKVVVPIDSNPEYNFIGRLMGPRGMTIKRLKQETGCRLLVRGKGSIKCPIREETLRHKEGYEHLKENLHISVQVKDAASRAQAKLEKGVEAVKRMLTPVANDELKQKQMRELAIINGTYRPVQQRYFQTTTSTTATAFGSMYSDLLHNAFC